MSLTFQEKQKKVCKATKTQKNIFCKMPALPQARDCGKIIKKPINHLAIIILHIQNGIHTEVKDFYNSFP